MNRGYLTIAARRSKFLEMAVDMALSLREYTEYPIALAADEFITDLAKSKYTSVFDHMTLLPLRFCEGRALKYGAAEASPFEETIFVDADCIVLDSIDNLFATLDTNDLAMVGEHLTIDEDTRHHGFSTSALIRRFGLESYLKTNSGLFCFRRSRAIAILEDCLECYLNEVRPQLRYSTLLGRWLGDELAFGIVGGRKGVGTLPKPDPMYWPQEFESLNLNAPGKPLLHMIWPPKEEVFEELMSATTVRRRDAAVSGNAELHWREEVRSMRRKVWRKSILGRFVGGGP